MNEFDIFDELRKKRGTIKTFHDLVTFLKDVKDHYDLGYVETPRAIAQATVAVAQYFASEFGMTGLQADFIMWDFIQDWEFRNNKTGLRLVNYDDMLYPQNQDDFCKKIILNSTWKALQKAAKENLENITVDKVGYDPNPAVAAHWKSIVDGKVPFGYEVGYDPIGYEVRNNRKGEKYDSYWRQGISG